MNILFVCTGNIFRSMSAEYCLKKYLEENNITEHNVASAGTIAKPESIYPITLNTLSSFGIDVSKHKQTKLTKEVIDKYDLIVAMADYHQKFIKDNFDTNSVLFDEIAYHENLSVLDDADIFSNLAQHQEEDKIIIKGTIKFIHHSIPLFMNNISEFLD